MSGEPTAPGQAPGARTQDSAAELPTGLPAATRIAGVESTAVLDPIARRRGRIARLLGKLPGWLQVRLSRVPPIRIDGQTLDPASQLLLSLRRRRRRNPLTAGTPEEARARHRRDTLIIHGRPTAVGSVRDLTVDGGVGPLPARHYAPPDAPRRAEPPPLLVYFHGGGFVIGDLDTHDEVCRILCRYGRQHVVSVAYRLAPENPFPAAIEDGIAALQWARRHATDLGADAGCVTVGGDSAGGNIAAMVARHAGPGQQPAAQLLIYPSIDHLATRPSHALFDDGFFLSLPDRDAFHTHFYGGVDPGDAGWGPLLEGDLTGLPPAFLAMAGFDILRDEGLAYARALEAAGSPCSARLEPALGHGFIQITHISRRARAATRALALDWRRFLDSLSHTQTLSD